MVNYLYNARDIASYFKWAGIPGYKEKEYLAFLFQAKDAILARPLAKDYDVFEHAVFKEMYYLWSEGFTDEYSDYSLISPAGSMPIFCEKGFLVLESYMKLIALHLMVSTHMSYVRVNFVGLPLLLGITAGYEDFERNLSLAFEALNLMAQDAFGVAYDISKGIPNEVLAVALKESFKKELFGPQGSRKRKCENTREKMSQLRKKSFLDRMNKTQNDATMNKSLHHEDKHSGE